MLSKSRPNIILIVMDTVRADHISCYGYGKRTTPFIDKIASKSILFENCYSPSSWTLPSHASIFTGSYLSKHNVGDAGDVLDSEFKTVASFFKDKGYSTFGLCYIPWVSKISGLDKGFDTFVSTRKESVVLKGLKKILKRQSREREGKTNASAAPDQFRSTEWITSVTRSKLHWMKTFVTDDGASNSNQMVKKWIVEQGQDRFFVFLNYCEAHAIYHPPFPYRYKFINKKSKSFREINQDHREYMYNNLDMSDLDFQILQGLYDGEISYLDHKIKDLYSFLKSQKLLDNTIIIITSDHGEQFGEKGFMGHARNLYNSLLKVPLIIKFPGKEFRAEVKSELVQTVDIFPTLYEIIDGNDQSILEQLQGNSLLSESIRNRDNNIAISEYKKQPFRGDAFANYSKEKLDKYVYALRSIVYKDYKYIWKSTNEEEVYNISNDKLESNNLIRTNLEEIEVLKQKLQDWLIGFESNGLDDSMPEKPQLDDAVIERLKSLGYY